VTDPTTPIAADAPERGSAAIGASGAAAHAAAAADAAAVSGAASRVGLTAATVVALVVLGAVLGVIGAVLVPWHPRVAGVAVPIAWGAAVLNFTAARLAQAAFRGPWAPALPFAGWLAVIAPMWLWTPGGDQFFGYDDVSVVYVAVAVLATAATVGTAATPASRIGR
jgi:hypothetical protein